MPNLPPSLTEPALAEWLFDNANPFHSGPLSSHTKIIRDDYGKFAHAVRALVEDRVRAALEYAVPAWEASSNDAAVRSVMGGA